MIYKVHQCLGITLISLENSTKTCNSCPTKKKKDCCKTQFKIIKTSTAQKADLLKIDVLKYIAVLPKTVFSESFSKILTSNSSSVQINAPPENGELALFIYHCNFRI